MLEGLLQGGSGGGGGGGGGGGEGMVGVSVGCIFLVVILYFIICIYSNLSI